MSDPVDSVVAGAADLTAALDRSLPVDAAIFKAAFRHHPAGVVVVTLDGGSRPVGFTATSLASVSLSPPLLSFAIAHSSSSWPAMQAADSFVINLLSADQHEIASRFATSGIDRFAPPTLWYPLPTGEPALDGTPAWLRCVVQHRVEVGDHDIVVGLATDAHVRDETVPLVYHDRRYHGLGSHSAVS